MRPSVRIELGVGTEAGENYCVLHFTFIRDVDIAQLLIQVPPSCWISSCSIQDGSY